MFKAFGVTDIEKKGVHPPLTPSSHTLDHEIEEHAIDVELREEHDYEGDV
jgi:hypothetical protein